MFCQFIHHRQRAELQTDNRVTYRTVQQPLLPVQLSSLRYSDKFQNPPVGAFWWSESAGTCNYSVVFPEKGQWIIIILSRQSLAKRILHNLRDELLVCHNHLAGSECPIVYWFGRGLRHTGEALLWPPLCPDQLNRRRYLRLNWKLNSTSDVMQQTL